ncbi:hypothetical protein PoB_000598400 [Plakobranchus ocellatus]|uniref:Uncharacterized protein n=1 Tax=Plakobranchus ocellatus TaxID=259542 RepID=A0AAV3YBL3_9GAST|nr:hypothetical protein PoB_000598400 [Plakobranchus ocellatus]
MTKDQLKANLKPSGHKLLDLSLHTGPASALKATFEDSRSSGGHRLAVMRRTIRQEAATVFRPYLPTQQFRTLSNHWKD